MQPEIPYRVVGKLGSCDVGTVWSAIDEARGLPVTVAVLDARAAADQRWRDAFAGHAGAINGAARTWVGADFAAPAPWVAFNGTEQPGAERVFISLGRPYTPFSPPPGEAPPNRPVSSMPVSAMPVSGMPVSSLPVSGTPISGLPVSGTPVSGTPVSGTPVSGSPVSGGPVSGSPANNMGLDGSPRRPYFGEGAQDPYGASVGGAKRDNSRLLIGIAAVVAVLVVGGAVILAVTQLGGGDKPEVLGPTPSASASASPSPTATPVRPGLEPPRPGDWPNWPKYAEGAPVRPFALQGIGFEVTLPLNWECTANPNAVQYTCGIRKDGAFEAGGEITMRECAAPCDESRRTDLRLVEDAFGAQWRFAGENTTIAENPKLDGVTGYGLVTITYFRSTELGPFDRQMVLHLTGANSWADEFRKIAYGIHDTVGS
ncbi:hypothetical protein [Catenuloplanes japonicus]|uniref:hypothetical protein n=1 Tax=Catenuloplanes japonicus TaxID=33876 RepID=UPI00068B7935|nr:hypothetical protein [Catenuloplanes japonicus]